MPATAERAQFIRSEFRSVSNGPNASIVAAYGNLAKRSEQPIETFFVAKDDAQAMCDERAALLGQHNRLLKNTVNGVETGLALDYVGVTPTALVIDDEGAINNEALISEVTMDFDKKITTLETWGPA